MSRAKRVAPVDANDASLPVATPARSRRHMWNILRRDRGSLVIALGVLTATVGVGLLIPPALGVIVDLASNGGTRDELLVPFSVLVGATVVQGLLGSVGWYLLVKVGETALATLRESVVAHALDLPQATVERAGTGDLVSRVSNDVDQVSEAMRRGVPELLWSSLTVLLTVAGLAVLDWRFALAGLASLPFYLWAAHGYGVTAPPLYAEERRRDGELSQKMLESFSGVRTIQAMLLGPRHLRRVADASQAARTSNIRTADATAWFFTRIHLGEFAGTSAVMLMGAWLVGNGTATLGEATAAALYFIRLYDPIGALINLLDQVQSATASLRRLVGVVEIPIRARSDRQVTGPRGMVVTDLRFGYDDGPDVLKGIDIEVRPGEHVALVGASGAGKTTLASVMAGVHPARSGVVEIGGVDIDDISRDRLADLLGVVTQECHVFAGTLADDLRLARPHATSEEIDAALDLVGASGWVSMLPSGLDTRVGAAGHQLTSVQAQQLALARLALRNPAIVVLDEATADAGSGGARVLEASIARLLQGRAALLVAHRLSTAATADRVVVLDRGRIVEDGSPEQLQAGDGAYATLWRAWQTGSLVPPSS